MRVLVCGGRDFKSDLVVDWTLNRVGMVHTIDEIIHGGARGADTLAGEWAKNHGIPVTVFPADWKIYGRAAGYIRNKQMLEEGKPDLVVAFPGGKGTANMVKLAKDAGIEVKIV